MQIHTTARHCQLDGDLRAFAEERLQKLERFARDIHEAHVILTAEKFRHVAEITLRVNRHELVSREESDEPRVALDRAADHLEVQLRKLKEKRSERHRAGLTADERASLDGNGAATDADTDVEDFEADED